MPKRSNDFQKLVLNITQQFASLTATVTESKELKDRDTDQPREVDIYIEDKSGPFALSVGIECTARSRKVDLPTLEQLHAKHQRLNVDRTVIVSKTGFAKTAAKYARRNNIDLLTLDEAIKLKWPDWMAALKNIKLDHYEFQITKLDADLEGLSPTPFKISDKIMVHSPSFGLHQIHDFIYLYHCKRGKSIDRGTYHSYEEWDFSPSLKVIDEEGSRVLCKKLRVAYTEKLSELPLEMTYQQFKNKPVVYGVTKNHEPFKRLALIASPTDERTVNGKPMFNISLHVDTE